MAIAIAVGGLSGGLSSAIVGGKFSAGFRQGLITSGLNHVAHATYKGIHENKLRNQLDKYSHLDIMLGDEWGRERAFQILVDKVPILRKEYLKSIQMGGKISIDMKGGLEGSIRAITNGDPGHAKITFYDLSFKDIYTFGETIHHELVHVYHHVSGIYQGWINKAGGEPRGILYAKFMSEHYAYAESYKVTGNLIWKFESENNLIDANNECKVWCK